MPLVEKDFENGMDFGVGINDVNGNPLGQATTRQTIVSPGGTGQTASFRMDMVQSLDDLHKQLGLSVDASASYGLFGGSNKFSFVQQSNFHSYAVFMYVHVTITNAYQQIEGEQIEPDAAALLSPGNSDRFRQQFGDVYVKGITSGGEYFALLQIETKSADDQTKITEDLKVNAGIGGVFSANIGAQFSSSVAHVQQTNSVSILSFQQGGSGASSVQETDVNAVITKASHFGEAVSQAPVPFRATVQEYTTLDLPAPPNDVDRQNAKDVLQQLAEQRMSLLLLINDIAFIQDPDNRAQFGPTPPGADLSVLANQASQAFNQVDKAASACANDIRACQLLTNLVMPDASLLPQRLKVLGAPSGPKIPYPADLWPLVLAAYPAALQSYQTQAPHAASRIISYMALAKAFSSVSDSSQVHTPTWYEAQNIARCPASSYTGVVELDPAPLSLDPIAVALWTCQQLTDFTQIQLYPGGISNTHIPSSQTAEDLIFGMQLRSLAMANAWSLP